MKTIFDRDFYPTPDDVIQSLLANEQIEDKIILEPSAGTGNIVSFLQNRGAAEVLACEKDEDFAKLLAQKCRVIANDFFTVTSDQISHIHAIYMNPRFQPMQNTSFMPGTLPRLVPYCVASQAQK